MTTNKIGNIHVALLRIAITAISLISWGNFSVTVLVDGFTFEPTSMVLTAVATSSSTSLSRRSPLPIPQHQGILMRSHLTIKELRYASRHYQGDRICRNPTSTALPLYLDPSQSLSAKNRQITHHHSPSSLSYRIDDNVDEKIVSLVQGIYKNSNPVMKNNDNIDDVLASTKKPKKSYLLLVGSEEGSSNAHHPPLVKASRQPYRSFITLMSTEGMMERHRFEYGLKPYVPDMVTPSKKTTYDQRISFFEGGEQFFSLSNLEYGVTNRVVNDAASTGLLVAFAVIMSMIHPFDTDNFYDYSLEHSINEMKLISSLVFSVPAVSAYMSVTRCTMGYLTRTMSTFWMNWVRLVFVAGTKATTVAAGGSSFIKDIVTEARPINSTAGDVTVPPVTEKIHESQKIERTEPLSSIPVLIGELVLFGSLAVVQQAKNIISKTTGTILNYQVNMIRNNRLQIQERKQRSLLEAQIYYTNNKRKTLESLKKQHAMSEEESVSGAMTQVNVTSLQSENVFLLEDSERDNVPSMAMDDESKQTTFIQENLFRFGGNEREDLLVCSKPHQLLGNIEFVPNQNIVIEKDDGFVTSPLAEQLFHLGQLERDDINIQTKTHRLLGNVDILTQGVVASKQSQPLFQLGQEDRDDVNVTVQTYQLFENVEQNRTISMDKDDSFVPVKIPQSEQLFHLGQLERDDINVQTKSHRLLGNVENVTQKSLFISAQQSERLFYLGQEERDDVTIGTKTHHLLGNVENVTRQLDFVQCHLGDNNRTDMSTSTETTHLLGNIDVGQETELPLKVEKSIKEQLCLDQEEKQIAEVHRLIQDRARTETKKRLHTLAESKSKDKVNEVHGQLKNQMEVSESTSAKTLKLKRSWKNLSHKIGKVKSYLARQRKIVGSDRYTKVQRGALYLLAATSSLFFNYLRKPTYSEHDDTEANIFISNQ